MTLMSKNQTNLNFKWNFTYCIIRIKAEKVNIGFFNQSVAWKEGMAGEGEGGGVNVKIRVNNSDTPILVY